MRCSWSARRTELRLSRTSRERGVSMTEAREVEVQPQTEARGGAGVVRAETMLVRGFNGLDVPSWAERAEEQRGRHLGKEVSRSRVDTLVRL